MNIALLRARVLYYFTLSQSTRHVRMSYDKLSSLLDWPECSEKTISLALGHLPDEIICDWDKFGIDISVETPEYKEDTYVVFEHWRKVTSRDNRSRLTAKRKRIIQSALKQYGMEVCKQAIEGLMKSQFHVEKGLTDLKFSLGDQEKIERHSGLASKAAHVDEDEQRYNKIEVQARKRRRGRRRFRRNVDGD